MFKLYYKNQTHLYNKNINFNSLKQFTQKVFRDLPKNFTFIYSSSNGQMTYIQTDADLIGLKYCCTAANDFIVKIHIMGADPIQKSLEQNIETVNLDIKKNLEDMYERVIFQLQEQGNKKIVKEYLTFTYKKVGDNIAKAQKKMVNQQVSNYLNTLYDISSTKLGKQQERNINLKKAPTQRKIRYSPQKPAIISSQKVIPTQNLQDIINNKILDLVPSLVDKIFAKMQKQLKNKCINCIKKQNKLQNTIDRQIRKRLACMNNQNPEQ